MAFLWAATRASSRLRISAFHRGFRTPLKHTCLGIVDTREVTEALEKRVESIPDNKECIVKTFKHPSEFENGMWMVGSNIYLADNDIIEAHERNVGEDEEDITGERWIDRDCIGKPTDKRRFVGGIRYKVDDEKGTVAGVECFMLAKAKSNRYSKKPSPNSIFTSLSLFIEELTPTITPNGEMNRDTLYLEEPYSINRVFSIYRGTIGLTYTL